MGMPSAGDASPPRDAPGRAPRNEVTKPPGRGGEG